MSAPSELYLGHAGHARPGHRLTSARKFGLDPEQGLSIDVGRYRRDPPDGERHRVAGKASRSETALLAGTQMVDVLFLDAERDAVAPHRLDFEQHIAVFACRAHFLAAAVRYQNAPTRRHAAGAAEPIHYLPPAVLGPRAP